MNLNQIIKKILSEATSDGGGRGSYVGPLQPGVRPFKNVNMQPFTIPVSKYDSPMLEFDSYDGSMDKTKKQIKKIESKAKKITNYIKKHPNSTFSDDDGNNINQTPGKKLKIVPVNEWIEITDDLLNEVTMTTLTAGEYFGPQELGLKKWKKSQLDPFNIHLDHEHNEHSKKMNMKNNISRVVGVWEENPDGTYDIPTHDVHVVNEDLAVWFGTKKKPKGSKQPKGPWVNICRKVDGKHPPCGRHDTSKGAYPKCRAAGVAGKMSDSEKRAACQQKRKAEKKDTQTGKGQKPIMTSYKPKKNIKENMGRIIRLTEADIENIVMRVLNEEINISNKVNKTTSFSQGLSLTCVKLNEEDPKLSETTDVGPYPWDRVKYDKYARPVKIYLSRPSDLPRDAVYGAEYENDEEMVLGFEEVIDPSLKKMLTNKKYVMVTYKTPALTGKQYCKVNGPMDPQWDENLFKPNESIIDPYTKLKLD